MLVAGPLGRGTDGNGWCNDLDRMTFVASTVSAEHARNRGLGNENEIGLVVPEIADPITVSEQRTYTHEGDTFRLHNIVPEVASPILGTDGHNRTPGSMGDTEGLLIPELVGALSDGAHRGGGRNGQDAYNGRIIPQLAMAFKENQRAEVTVNDTAALTLGGGKPGQGYPAVLAFKASHFTRDKDGALSETYPPLSADADKGDQDPLVLAVAGGNKRLAHARVRRLTPLECERLQGFPDHFTRIMYRKKPAADGPRYRALGNSMAVPVMHWLGKRIDLVEQMLIKFGRPNT